MIIKKSGLKVDQNIAEHVGAFLCTTAETQWNL